MTNYQCYCYAVKAIANILRSKEKITPDKVYCELHYLWDIYSEEAIEKIVQKEELDNELF